ncbi:MAG: hypothetical protein ACC669_12225, partial [bacterium]
VVVTAYFFSFSAIWQRTSGNSFLRQWKISEETDIGKRGVTIVSLWRVNRYVILTQRTISWILIIEREEASF